VIYTGFGLGQLGGGYREDVPAGLDALSVLVGLLVTTPLITAMSVTAVLDLARGKEPSVRHCTRVALDAFAYVLGAMLIYVAGVALGLTLLIVPGLYLAVRWYFVTQAVVMDARRGLAALERSGELVRGSWWRVVGIGVAFNLLVLPAVVLAGSGIHAAAKATDSGAVYLVAEIVAQTVILSFMALATTLVYFDLRLRRDGPPPRVGLAS
jgi:hypothetical protein